MDNHHTSFFEVRMPRNPLRPPVKKKLKKKSTFDYLKKTIGDPVEEEPVTQGSPLPGDLSFLGKDFLDRIDSFRRDIETNKIQNIVKKRIVPFLVSEDQNVRKIVLIEVNRNLRPLIPLLAGILGQTFKGVLIPIIDSDDVSQAKRAVAQGGSDKLHCVFFHEVFESPARLNDTLKLFTEELCRDWSRNAGTKRSLGFVVLGGQSLGVEGLGIGGVRVKTVEFYESQQLFGNLLERIYEEIEMVPVIGIAALRELMNELEYWQFSFQESVEKLKTRVLYYLSLQNSTVPKRKDEMEVCVRISNRDFQVQTPEALYKEGKLLDLKTVVSNALKVLRLVFNRNLNKPPSVKLKLIKAMVSEDKPLKILDNSSLSIETLASEIHNTILTSNLNPQGIFTEFSTENFFQLGSKSVPKARSKKDKRNESLLTDQKVTEFSKLKVLESGLNLFLRTFVIANLESISEVAPFLIISGLSEINDSVSPDILGSTMNAIHSQVSDNDLESKFNRILLRRMDRMSRKFEITSLSAACREDCGDDQGFEARFFYGLNEMRMLGFVGSVQKNSVMFQRGLYAKTFFQDYSQREKGAV